MYKYKNCYYRFSRDIFNHNIIISRCPFGGGLIILEMCDTPTTERLTFITEIQLPIRSKIVYLISTVVRIKMFRVYKV